MNPASVTKRLKANGASLMPDFHYRASPKIAWLRLCQITNESTVLKFKQRVALAVELRIYEEKWNVC